MQRFSQHRSSQRGKRGALRQSPLVAGLTLLFAVGCSSFSAPTGEMLPDYRVGRAESAMATPTWLANSTSQEFWGRLHPNQPLLLYVSDQKGNLDIWRKDLTTGMPTLLIDHPAKDTQPSWSPDGKRFVFVSMREDAKGDLYLWSDGELRRLTDAVQSETDPVFSANGRSIYYTAGNEIFSRIERLDLESGKKSPITDWGTRHPAVSPDGNWLAYTRVGRQVGHSRDRRAGESGSIVLHSLNSSTQCTIVHANYPAGFPSFAPDGARLYFVRFYRGARQRAPRTNSITSIWSVDATNPCRKEHRHAPPELKPLTSNRYAVHFPQATRYGPLVTSNALGTLDVALIPASGLVPRFDIPQDQLTFAAAIEDPWDQWLALQYVDKARDDQAYATAQYRAAHLLTQLGELDKARTILDRLITDLPESSDIQALARIDRSLIAVSRAHGAKDKTHRAPIDAAIATLQSLTKDATRSALVRAHATYRLGTVYSMLGRSSDALRQWERVLSEHRDQPLAQIESQIAQAEWLASSGQPRLAAPYLEALLRKLDHQTALDLPTVFRLARRLSHALIVAYEPLTAAAQRSALSAAIVPLQSKKIGLASATLALYIYRRIAQLDQSEKKYNMACEAMQHAAQMGQRFPLLRESSANAAIDAAQIALTYREALRRKRQTAQAMELFSTLR